VLIPVESVEWLEAARNYVRLHVEGRTHLVRASLTALGERLPDDRFVRVHRSAIVNLDAVDRFEPFSHGDWTVYLRSGERVRLSRRYRDRLQASLEG
jgi:two-component system LytT family response regulator